ncbi:MAG: hybrid sensor histidine kinase/response regulator [Anaerolineae bacterium]
MPKATILIVEDDTHLLNGIRDILALEDYRVLTAENGKLALNVLTSEPRPPDLIVSDIMMPEMDGLEFLNKVRQNANWVSLPFMFLTAKTEKTDVQAGRRLGVDDYLNKPFDAEDLIIAIEARLKRQRSIHEFYTGAMSNLKKNILMILNHEFRTPLTLVVAYSDMLTDPNVADMNRDELRSFLNGISAGAERLRRLVENFITLVELEMGESRKIFDWRKAPLLDVELLLKEACEHARRNPKLKHTLTIQVTGAIPPFVADREYLNLALVQLIDNAVKFSKSDKSVIVGAHADKDWVYIWVKDEGRGVPVKSIDEIWDTFNQAEREIFEDQGTGSGLAIVRGVVALHGGQVTLQSERGVGSTFTIVLPVAPAS